MNTTEKRKRADPKVTQEQVKDLLSYDPETGVFIWRKKWGSVKPGEIAGIKDGVGYITIGLNYRYRLAHRLAFLYMTGNMPKYVDHINGVRGDNRWINLRVASRSDNNCNSALRSDNQSGVKGVSFHKQSGKWKASLNKDKVTYTAGYFSDKNDAVNAIKELRERLHKEFTNHG